MCSSQSNEDTTTYDPPTPVRPRTYVLSGSPVEPLASPAVIVLAEMLSEAEDRAGDMQHPEGWFVAAANIQILREARNRVMAAEARL